MHPRTALILLSIPFLHAQAGHWAGSIQVPNAEMAIEIDLMKTPAGELAGTLSSPPQNLSGFPLSNLAMKGQSIKFQVKGSAPGERQFDGSLSADGQSISGEFSQSGRFIPFSITRTGDPRIEAPIKNPAINKELEGVWHGALNGTETLVLTLSNQPDGATGVILNVADGLEIPLGAITQKDSALTLDLKAVGGSYSGALNTERTELAGTFKQGSLVLPITFRREAKK